MTRKRKTDNTNDIKKQPYYRYAQSVINGDIVAGELIQLACKRFLSDLERKDLEFRADIVDRFFEFTQLFHHFKGRSAGEVFRLEPWQTFIAANILGFYWKHNGRRRFTNSFISISRKSGKTAYAALFCLWFLIMDGEGSPEVDLSANSRDQSRIAFEFVEQFARQIDPQQRDLKILRNAIRCDFNVGKINVFAADSTKLDGWNSSFCLVDEFGAARNSKMYDVLKSSQGQRKNPHLMIISTVGFDLSSPFYKMYSTNCEILRGLKKDDSTFIAIYALDEEDDWKDERNWPKFAPNIGVTVDYDYLREQVTAVENNASMEVGILTKNFNKWCQTSETWIADKYLAAVTEEVNLDDFKECECWVGIDLASVSDCSAVAYLLKREDDDKLYVKTDIYLPESALVESPNRELYKYYVRTKQLKTTSGNVQDYDAILTDILRNRQNLLIRSIGYDQYNATQFCISATEAGLPMQPFSQSISNFNRPTKELERLIKQRKIVIDNNECIRWMFANVSLKTDWNANTKPDKGSNGRGGKIDAVIAIIEALGEYLDTPRFTGSITVL